MRQALEAHFRPEFLNRFQHIVTFHSLSKDQVNLIAQNEIRKVLSREGITARNLIVELSDSLLSMVVDKGFDERYGARALKREIQHLIIMPIATFLIEQNIHPGCILKLETRKGAIRVRIIDTEQSLFYKEESKPIKIWSGKSVTRIEVEVELNKLKINTGHLQTELQIDLLRTKISRLQDRRNSASFWQDTKIANEVILELDRLLRMVSRIERFYDVLEDLEQMLQQASSRQQIQSVTVQMQYLNNQLEIARREYVFMGREGESDALVEISPIGQPGTARNYIFDIYSRWAKWHNTQLIMLREPLDDREPIMFGLKGPFVFGLIQLEAGLHRFREEQKTSVIRVKVAPWLDVTGNVTFSAHYALKKVGQLNGKIRSRVEIDHAHQLVLQNSSSLSENRDLACEIVPTWVKNQIIVDEVIRRYDMTPFIVRDYLTSTNVGKKDILKAKYFHELLCHRVDKKGNITQGHV